MSKGPEAKLKLECRAWLRSIGAYVFSPVQMGMGTTTVDDLVCIRGLFLGVEYKRPDMRPEPTPRQKRIMQEIASAGGATQVVYELADLQDRVRRLRVYYPDVLLT